jgi:hypothetical protein
MVRATLRGPRPQPKQPILRPREKMLLAPLWEIWLGCLPEIRATRDMALRLTAADLGESLEAVQIATHIHRREINGVLDETRRALKQERRQIRAIIKDELSKGKNT